MNHVPLSSSTLKSAALEGGKMAVRFHCSTCKGTGGTGKMVRSALTGEAEEIECAKCDGRGHSEYHFTELPPDPEQPERKPIHQVHAELMAAPSAGSYFAANIRGKYQTERV